MAQGTNGAVKKQGRKTRKASGAGDLAAPAAAVVDDGQSLPMLHIVSDTNGHAERKPAPAAGAASPAAPTPPAPRRLPDLTCGKNSFVLCAAVADEVWRIK